MPLGPSETWWARKKIKCRRLIPKSGYLINLIVFCVMVLELAYAAISKALPSKYWLRLIFAVVCVIILRTLSQGRKTTRERNLNARVILVTVAWLELLSTSFQRFTLEFGWIRAVLRR